MAQAEKSSLSGNGGAASRVVERRVVSAPGRTIQVERVQISDEQRSSVSSALRTGRTRSNGTE